MRLTLVLLIAVCMFAEPQTPSAARPDRAPAAMLNGTDTSPNPSVSAGLARESDPLGIAVVGILALAVTWILRTTIAQKRLLQRERLGRIHSGITEV